MTADLIDFVALSLLPIWMWRDIGAQLRAGDTPASALGRLLTERWPGEPGRRAELVAAAAAALVPGTKPLPQFFPQRNRIISGLSRAVVIVEAGERSGSLITARCALEQGRDVLAVPGNVLSGRNRGGHALLRDGARIVERADDILEELQGVGGLDRSVQPLPRP